MSLVLLFAALLAIGQAPSLPSPLAAFKTIRCEGADSISSLTLDPRDSVSFCLQEGGLISARNYNTGKLLWTRSEPAALQIAYHKRMVVAVMRVPILGTLDASTGDRVDVITGSESEKVISFAFDSYGEQAWIGIEGGVARLSLKHEMQFVPLDARPLRLALAASKGVVFAANDGHLVSIDTKSCAPKPSKLPSCGSIAAMACDANLIAVACSGSPVQVFDINSGEAVLALDSKTGVSAVVVCKALNRIAVGYDNGGIAIADIERSRLVAEWQSSSKGPVRALAFNPKRKDLIAAVGSEIIVFPRIR